MTLIGKLVQKLLKTGSLTLLLPGKPPQTFGPGGERHLTVRFTDRKVALQIATNPRLKLGEAYMDGRVVIEDGTILDLLEMIVGSNRWEDGGKGRAAMRRGKRRLSRLFSHNNLRRARRNRREQDGEQNGAESAHGHQGRETVFTVVMNLIASITPSLMPRPLSFTPPKGDSSSRYPGISFTFTVPARMPLIARVAASSDWVTTPLESP